jgi:hypothetical protein
MEVGTDRNETLRGFIENGKEDRSPLNWMKDQSLVVASGDGLRHDFFHYFLDKIYERKQKLSEKEKKLYQAIKNASWAS